MVRRDLKNIQDDLRLLERYGLIRMTDATSSGNAEFEYHKLYLTRLP